MAYINEPLKIPWYLKLGIRIVPSPLNFWARLIQGLGIPPAGFHDACAVLDPDKYGTLKK